MGKVREFHFWNWLRTLYRHFCRDSYVAGRLFCACSESTTSARRIWWRISTCVVRWTRTVGFLSNCWRAFGEFVFTPVQSTRSSLSAWVASLIWLFVIFTVHSYAERCLCCNSSVCLPVTRRYCVKTNERRMMPSSQLGSILTLVFGSIRFINMFARCHP